MDRGYVQIWQGIWPTVKMVHQRTKTWSFLVWCSYRGQWARLFAGTLWERNGKGTFRAQIFKKWYLQVQNLLSPANHLSHKPWSCFRPWQIPFADDSRGSIWMKGTCDIVGVLLVLFFCWCGLLWKSQAAKVFFVQRFHSLACQKPTTAWKCPKHPGINACCHERPWVRCFGCQQDQSIWLVFSYLEVPWSRLGDSPCLGSSGLTCFRRFPGGKKPSVIGVPWGVTLFKDNMSVHDCLIKLQYMFTIVSIVSICFNFWYLDMF